MHPADLDIKLYLPEVRIQGVLVGKGGKQNSLVVQLGRKFGQGDLFYRGRIFLGRANDNAGVEAEPLWPSLAAPLLSTLFFFGFKNLGIRLVYIVFAYAQCQSY